MVYPSGELFHPKADERCGFLIKIGVLTIYYAGDTDHIPEMNGLNPDIALVPVSGTYVMTAREAVDAVKDINPKLAIPMHYGTIVGDESDATYLKSTSSARVEILQKER
jgi:L-ascorbate metabolism protein UlaG (beta-lactamase superfamily)